MLNVYKIIHYSTIYGPKMRTVIWFKGCSLRCKGCINPELWSKDPATLYSVEDLVKEVKGKEVTLLGGEPLEQEYIVDLLLAFKANNIGVLMFTGYSLNDRSIYEKAKLCDIVVSEPFILEELNYDLYLRGSNNQVITSFTNRYSKDDFKELEMYEVVINDSVELRGRDKSFIDKLLF